MAKWIDTVVKILVELMQEQPDLAKEILLTIKKIERHPTLGTHTQGSYRVYCDPEKLFRIGYNFHPEAEEVEIVVLHLAYLPC